MSIARIIRHLKSYAIAYIFIGLHFFNGIVNQTAVLVTSIWVLLYFSFKRRVDIFLVFLLLIPAIVFDTTGTIGDIDMAPTFFSEFNSTVILGPLAISTRLAFSMAVLARILLYYKQIRFPWLTTAWLIAVVLAVLGLAYAVILGNENSSGITVGFRISLSLGAVLVGKCIENREDFYTGLDKIVLLSMLLLVANLMGGHWFFATFGLIPYFWMRIRPRILSIIPFFYSINLLYNLGSTITVLGILVLGILFYLFMQSTFLRQAFFKKKAVILFLIFVPVAITLFVLQLNTNGTYDLTTVQGYAEFKLLGDRKPVWDATLELIGNSFFIMPAGSTMIVYFDFLHRAEIWEAGAHNIFLEIGKQIGGLGMLLLSVVILKMLFKTGKLVKEKRELVLFYCFLTIYMMLGLTGNSLVYDGVGAFFWFLLGQFYQLLRQRTADENIDGPELTENAFQPALA